MASTQVFLLVRWALRWCQGPLRVDRTELSEAEMSCGSFFGLGSDEFPLEIGDFQGRTVNLPESNSQYSYYCRSESFEYIRIIIYSCITWYNFILIYYMLFPDNVVWSIWQYSFRTTGRWMLIVIIKYDCHYCCVSPVAGSILYDF
jgi:hypothetical protein